MTATELYAIVKNHKDVWGDVLEYAECEPPDPPIWCMGVNENIMVDEADAEGEEWKREAVALDDRISEGACPVSLVAVEYALLGLGVKWLASGGGTGNSYIEGMLINARGESNIEVVTGPPQRSIYKRLTNPLAAVYAAIAEVKRNTKETI